MSRTLHAWTPSPPATKGQRWAHICQRCGERLKGDKSNQYAKCAVKPPAPTTGVHA